jgi:hypothetical protein
MDQLTPPLQTHIQINFYRMNQGNFEYLILKRVDHEEDFWQGVTEQVKEGGDIAETVKRAAAEQVGIRNFKRLSEEMYSYEWYTHGQRGRDIVFAAEVIPETVIDLNTARYSDFQWLPYEQAVQHIKWSGAKDALQELHTFLEAKRLSNPEYWAPPETSQAGSFSPDEKMDVGQTAMEHSGSPYGSNVPKRLPDRPGNGGIATDSDQEANTSEWFL